MSPNLDNVTSANLNILIYGVSEDKNRGILNTYHAYNGMPVATRVNNTLTSGLNSYSYSASGEKLSVEYYASYNEIVNPISGSISYQIDEGSLQKRVHYDKNIIFENYALKKILIDNGYIEDGNYYFYIKDHLGNNRVVANAQGTAVQRTDYYPFGMPYANSTGQDTQPFKYNGKEYDTMHGLNQYDYHARQYDPVLPRFTSMDPLAEKYYSWSPYVYVGNNPIRRTDPTGMIWNDLEEAEELKGKIDNRIRSLNKDIEKNQKKLEKGGLSDSKIAKLNDDITEVRDRISNLEISKSDIDRLGADLENIYALSDISGGKHKVRQGSDGIVYIETSSDAISIHEITHVRQSLDAGGLRFSSGGELLNAGATAPVNIRYQRMSGMEIEAYQMQYSYDKSFPGRTGSKGLRGIDVHSVGNIRDGGKLVYPSIKDYSIYLKNLEKIIRP